MNYSCNWAILATVPPSDKILYFKYVSTLNLLYDEAAWECGTRISRKNYSKRLEVGWNY